MRGLLVLTVILAACSTGVSTTTQQSTTTSEAHTTTSTSTTTTTNPLNDEVAALRTERDRLLDELAQMEDYIVSLEDDFAAWVDYALQLEMILETPPEPVEAGPTVEWCAQYELALRQAAMMESYTTPPSHSPEIQEMLPDMPQHPFSLSFGQYMDLVRQPMLDVGCPDPSE